MNKDTIESTTSEEEDKYEKCADEFHFYRTYPKQRHIEILKKHFPPKS